MDTETLVKDAVQKIQKSLAADGQNIQLRITPYEYGWEKYVIHAKPENPNLSCFDTIDLVIDKLHELHTSEIKRRISHVQVYDVWNNPSCSSREIEKLFVEV